jgi:hypothetical protein
MPLTPSQILRLPIHPLDDVAYCSSARSICTVRSSINDCLDSLIAEHPCAAHYSDVKTARTLAHTVRNAWMCGSRNATPPDCEVPPLSRRVRANTACLHLRRRARRDDAPGVPRPLHQDIVTAACARSRGVATATAV